MMRYILCEANRPTVPLSWDLAFLSGYVEVEKMRHYGQIDIHYDVQGIRTDCSLELLSLLPFVENAFRHGLKEETQKEIVHIVICQINHDLTLQVMNSIPRALKKSAVYIRNQHPKCA